MKIAIIGLGYVGLPLSLQFARSGVAVLGLDVDPARVDALNQGRSYIKHAPPEAVAEAIKSGTFFASTDFERIKEVSAIIICVPTTLNRNCEPDISFIINTGKTIARHLQTGTLVVLESPTYPGAADDDLLEVLEVGSGLEVGRDFHLAFSAERGDPGNPEGNVAFMPKVIGGCTEACSEKARALYSMAINSRASVVLSRGGANEPGQENLAQREHCAGI